jgi:LysR family glycine cleavage system transcriptional activator
MRRLPPLNSLKAFEATARHLSFTKAAEELNVTAGAVSQQVKTLEEYLGQKLFKRKNRQIFTTTSAQLCLPHLSAGLDKLAEAMMIIQEHGLDKPLTITIPPTFASRWLMPRLNDFKQKHPEIEVRIDASNEMVDLVNEDIDVGIRFGTGDYAGLDSDFLFSQEVFPVCSPEILKTGPRLKTPEDLKHYTLLHGEYFTKDSAQVDWDMWFATVGINSIDTSHGLHFSQHDLVVQAAIQGHGVALVGSVVIDNDLKEGRLVQLFESRIPLEFSYYFICSKTKTEQTRVKAFRKWVLEQVTK